MSEISEVEKAVEYLKERKDNQITDWKIKAYDTAIQALEEKQQRQWVPVSKGLPLEKSGARLLVTLKNKMVTECFWICGEFKYADGHRMELFSENNKPVAWMPLPEPWKEGNHE